MKVLWIVNKCCGALHQKIYGKKATGGQWLEAMLQEVQKQTEDKIVVVNIEENPAITEYSEGNVSFYTLKGKPNEHYDYKSAESVKAWKTIFEKEKPDIMEIWGTEFPYALAAFRACPDIPSVVFVQGILDSIAKYYISGLTEKELKKALSLRDVLSGTTIKQTARAYQKRVEYEKEIVRRAKHIIVENHWAESYYKKMCPGVNVHFCPISISDSFSKVQWSEEGMEPHTIMCPAANYPIKGLHMLLHALAIVKKFYPNVRLYIPGTAFKEAKTIKAKLKQHGYDRLILSLVKKLDLSENVVYVGRLTADEMASKMASVNCFAMTSAIENHSSTLKEAMTVGTPCVSSYVGGVPEYAVNEENCLLYRFEDYEMLAYNIGRLFEDASLRRKLSENAVKDLRKPKDKTDYERMREIIEISCHK